MALAENAVANGVDFHLGEEVKAITRTNNHFEVETSPGKLFKAQVLINSAGLYADKICKMAGIREYRIYPCRGEYLILDKRLEGSLSTLVYPAPRKGGAGLGIHLTNTVDGNILIGPSNEYIDEPDDYACTADVIKLLKKEGHELLPGLSTSDFIRNFSGLRSKQTSPEEKGFKDFVIESRQDLPGFINLVGIESPGLTSSPAIALMVKDMVAETLSLKEKPSFIAERKGLTGFFHELPPEEKADLIAEDPDYGEIICRCEQITKKGNFGCHPEPFGEQNHKRDQVQSPRHDGTVPGWILFTENSTDTGKGVWLQAGRFLPEQPRFVSVYGVCSLIRVVGVETRYRACPTTLFFGGCLNMSRSR